MEAPCLSRANSKDSVDTADLLGSDYSEEEETLESPEQQQPGGAAAAEAEGSSSAEDAEVAMISGAHRGAQPPTPAAEEEEQQQQQQPSPPYPSDAPPSPSAAAATQQKPFGLSSVLGSVSPPPGPCPPANTTTTAATAATAVRPPAPEPAESEEEVVEDEESSDEQQQQQQQPRTARPASASGSHSHYRAGAQHQQPAAGAAAQGSDSEDDAGMAPRIESLPQSLGLPLQLRHHHLQQQHKQHALPAGPPSSHLPSHSQRSRRSSASSTAAHSLGSSTRHGAASGEHPPSLTYPGPRPASHERQAERVASLMHRHPATWDVRDVGAWVEHVGMGQYRKSFTHQQISGALLLQATDHQLKHELGIGPFGHRRLLLDAVSQLAMMAEELPAAMQPQGGSSARARPLSARTSPSSTYPGLRRPASAQRAGLVPPDAFLGPAMGRTTVQEQAAKLRYELDRACTRAGAHRSLVQQLSHTAATSGDEVVHLRGLLQDLERRIGSSSSGQHVGGLDRLARVPWRPPSPSLRASGPHFEQSGGPGDDRSFQPRIWPSSARASSSKQAASSTTFLDRLEVDIRRREVNRAESARRQCAPEVVFQDAMLQRKRMSKDWQLLSKLFPDDARDNDGVRALSMHEVEYNAQLDQAAVEHQEEWQLSEQQLGAIWRLKGPKKVSAVAGAIRTAEFMRRYYSELHGREERLRELQRDWWQRYMGRGKQDKQAGDMDASFKFFVLLGWVDMDEATMGLSLTRLLRRAMALKQAREKATDRSKSRSTDLVDWTMPPWSQDGLQTLQESCEQAAGAEPTAATPARSMSRPSDNNYLMYTVDLLARVRWDELQKAEGWLGSSLQLGLFRLIRTQRFIDFTEKAIEAKERKLQEAYDAMRPQRKVLSKGAADSFYDRLLDDAVRRQETTARLVEEKKFKENKIVETGGAMFGKGNKK